MEMQMLPGIQEALSGQISAFACCPFEVSDL